MSKIKGIIERVEGSQEEVQTEGEPLLESLTIFWVTLMFYSWEQVLCHYKEGDLIVFDWVLSGENLYNIKSKEYLHNRKIFNKP